MRLNAPTQIVWVIALVLGVLGLLGMAISIPFVSDYSFWFVFVAWLLMMLATYFKGM